MTGCSKGIGYELVKLLTGWDFNNPKNGGFQKVPYAVFNIKMVYAIHPNYDDDRVSGF